MFILYHFQALICCFSKVRFLSLGFSMKCGYFLNPRNVRIFFIWQVCGRLSNFFSSVHKGPKSGRKVGQSQFFHMSWEVQIPRILWSKVERSSLCTSLGNFSPGLHTPIQFDEFFCKENLQGKMVNVISRNGNRLDFPGLSLQF